MKNRLFILVLTIIVITSCNSVSNASSISIDVSTSIVSSVSITSSSTLKNSSSNSIFKPEFDLKIFKTNVANKYHTKDKMEGYYNSKNLTFDYSITRLLNNPYFVFIPPQPDQGFGMPYVLRFPNGDYKDQNKEFKKYLMLTDFGSADSIEYDDPIRQYIMRYLYGDSLVEYRNSDFSKLTNELDLITISPMIARQCPALKTAESAFNQHLARDSILATYENRTNYVMKYCDETNVPLNLPISEKDFVAMVDVELQVKNMIIHALELLNSNYYDVESKILMMGYSTTGAFVQRFASIYPELIKAYYGGGVAVPFVPGIEYQGQKLLYPLGAYDHKEFFGKEFNLKEFNNVAKIYQLGKFEKRLDAVDKAIWPIVEILYTGPLEIYGDHSNIDKEVLWNKHADAFYTVGGVGMHLFNLETGHYRSENDMNFIKEFFKLNLNSSGPVYPLSSPYSEHIVRLG